MTSHTEPSSSSVKFTPMPMSQLLANLMPLRNAVDSPDASFSSADDSDTSISETVAKKPSPLKKINKDFYTPVAKPLPKDIKAFASEKKCFYNENDKENNHYMWAPNKTHPTKENLISQSAHKNICSNVYPNSEVKNCTEKKCFYNENDKENNHYMWAPNKTHPIKEKLISQSAHKNICSNVNPNSELKNCNVLRPQQSSEIKKPAIPAIKKTPDIKVPQSSQKVKSSTPKIKSGIRKFTPGSSKKKKTPQKAVAQNRDRVRCELFTQIPSKDEALCPPPKSEPIQMPVPETPLNKKVMMPTLCAATPSYPQGVPQAVVGNNSKILFKTTKIKDKKYMFIKKLGVGGSSEVYKVFEVGTSCEYAVKCVYLAMDHELAQGYINEVRLLRELQNSDRVIRLYDYEYDRTNHFLRLVLEVGETDLSSFLKARGAGLPPALVLHYWEEMLHAVHYIHDHGVIHADLKPANFLLVCGQLKLIDFGIASAISSDATSVVRARATGTYSYISPEALMGGAGGAGGAGLAADGSAPIKISFRSDVWSLGCILYSMVYGRTPFGHFPNFAKLDAIIDPNHRIDYPPAEHHPPSLIAALKWCLTYNARARPYVRELLAIPYLQPSQAQAGRAPLPQALLDKLQPLVTPQEFMLLQRAQV